MTRQGAVSGIGVPETPRQRASTEVVGFIRQLLEALRVEDLDLAAFMIVSAAEGIGGNASVAQFDDRLAKEVSDLVYVYLTGAETRSS